MQDTNDDKAFSSIDFVGQCLVDEERTNAFRKAIRATVKKNDIVLDLGTGSGVMALYAAKAGAKKVFAIEFDPFVASIAKKIFQANQSIMKKLSLLLEDARTVSFPRKVKFDVVISEMLTTAMIDEPQVKAINNLHAKGLVNTSTQFIPERHDTFIALAHTNYAWFGVSTAMILHLWKWHNWSKLKLKMMSTPTLLNSISFKEINKEKFTATVEMIAQRAGTVNSLHLTSKSILSEGIVVGDTEALNAPMLIPLKKVKQVVLNQKVCVKVAYIFGGGYGSFKADIL